MTKTKPRVLIIGLGEIGYHDAAYMINQGLEVDGYDVDSRATCYALRKGVLHDQATSFRNYDYYVIAVSTHNPANPVQPSFDALFQTAEQLTCEGKENALVAIESTVTQGTSEEVKDILGHRLHVAHIPHRFYRADKAEHGVQQLRVLGGCESCCTKEALHFYTETLRIPTYRVSSVELAELSKVIENSYRFLEIAFAEELKMLCDTHGWDFEELRGAINSKWNVKILEAKKGIDGHCLPKDSQMYLNLANGIGESSLLDLAKTIDQEYKRRLTENDGLEMLIQGSFLRQRPIF